MRAAGSAGFGAAGLLAAALLLASAALAATVKDYALCTQFTEMEEKLRACDRIIESDDNPQNQGVAYFHRGYAWERLGDRGRAVVEYSKAIALLPDWPDAWINRGNARYRLGELRPALEDYDRAIGLAPGDIAGYVGRGNAWSALGERDKAIADFTEAIRLRPEHPTAYANRAVEYYETGKEELAFADFQAAIDADPRYPLTYYNRGNVLFHLGDYVKAEADYSRAIERAPGMLDAIENRANARRHTLDSRGAVEDYRYALARRSKNDIRRLYAWALFEAGEFEESAAQLAETLVGQEAIADKDVLMIYVALKRAGKPLEIRAFAEKYRRPSEGFRLFELFLGERSPGGLLAGAPGDDPGRRSSYLCVARYFIAQKHILDGAREEARAALRNFLDSCPKYWPEYPSARLDLARLE